MATQHTGSPSPAEPREDTPLLRAEDGNGTTGATTTAPQHNDNTGEDEATLPAEETISRTRPSLAPVDQAILIMSSLAIGTGVSSFAFSIANMQLLLVGDSRYGYYDYDLEVNRAAYFWAVVICIFVSAFNIARLRREGKPCNSLISIIVLGLTGIFFSAASLSSIADRFAYPQTLCREGLKGGPRYSDGSDSWYPGTYQECLEWAPKYLVITWIYLALFATTSLIFLAIAITFLVRAYKNRSHVGSNFWGTSGSRFTLPAGQLSIEVAVRWGSQHARRDETRGQED